MTTVCFASPYCLIDYSSGAAIATRRTLDLLTRQGFGCQAYCASRLDFGEEVVFEQTLAELNLPYDVRHVHVGEHAMRLVFTRVSDVPVTIFRWQFTRPGLPPAETPAFLAGFQRFLEANRPEVVLTYGGDAVGFAITEVAKHFGCRVVFALHNLAYRERGPFAYADRVIVPSQFAQEHYRRTINLETHVLPNIIDPAELALGERDPKYLTFINPQPAKGLFLVARIVEQLAQHRPDIPVLIVEGRSRADSLARTGVDLSGATNVYRMPNTTDPRAFYSVTRCLLMPSLIEESFGSAAAEAMACGIPVICSNRGALPETVGESGIVLDVPSGMQPTTAHVPSPEDVTPWTAAVKRLWDDQHFYDEVKQRSADHARRWHPDALASHCAKAFESF